jgi:hypothetical protein
MLILACVFGMPLYQTSHVLNTIASICRALPIWILIFLPRVLTCTNCHSATQASFLPRQLLRAYRVLQGSLHPTQLSVFARMMWVYIYIYICVEVLYSPVCIHTHAHATSRECIVLFTCPHCVCRYLPMCIHFCLYSNTCTHTRSLYFSIRHENTRIKSGLQC